MANQVTPKAANNTFNDIVNGVNKINEINAELDSIDAIAEEKNAEIFTEERKREIMAECIAGIEKIIAEVK